MNLDALLDALDQHRGCVPVDELESLLSQLDICADGVCEKTHFCDETYKRNLLRQGPAYQAFLMCWRDGQRSPIHDHRGSACGIHVVKGTLVEQCYEFDTDGVCVADARNEMGEGKVCASWDADKHAVIAEKGDLITLHIYSPPMSTIGIYEEGSAEVGHYTYPSFDDEKTPVMQGWA